MTARASLIATSIAVLALTGCEDLGLENRNYPLEQAKHRPPDALVQAVHPETDPRSRASETPAHGPLAEAVHPVSIGEQSFQAAGLPIRVAAASLRPVGTVAGGSFSAATADPPPYDRIYRAHPGGLYVVYLPVGPTGDPAARLAAQRHVLEDGAPAAH